MANLDYLPDEVLLNYIRNGRADLNEWHRAENEARKKLAGAQRMVASRWSDLTDYLAEANRRGIDPNPDLGTILYVGTKKCAKEKGFPEVLTPADIGKLRGTRAPVSIVICAHCYSHHSSALIQEAVEMVDVINRTRR